MVILITGSRYWNDESAFQAIRNELSQWPDADILVHGAARGIDTIADVVGKEMGFKVISCPAHWRHTNKCPPDCQKIIGKAAGAIRNRYMLDTYKPWIVLAFHPNIEKSKGTKDMVKYATSKKIPVKLISS